MIHKMPTVGSGGGSVAELDLLWENPNPAANFSAQTVNFTHTISNDATGYIILYKNSGSSTYAQKAVICPLISSSSPLSSIGFVSTNNNSSGRNIITADGTKMQFGSGYTGTTVSNGSLIPTKIYAIKGLELPLL